jgi:hypothetical protein
MIGSIEIVRLRGIREGKLLDLTPLVVLVGPNATGKSTILDALMIGANPRPPWAMGQMVRRREGLSQGARWLLWKAGNEGPAEFTVTTRAGVSRKCLLSVSSQSEEYTTIEGSITDQDALGNAQSNTIHALFRSGEPPQVTAFFKPFPDVPEVRFIDPDVSALKTPLPQLYTGLVEQGLQRQAKELIKALIPNLEDIQILASGNSPVLYLVYPGYAVPAAFAGDGVRLLLHLSFELAVQQGGLVLMEEPEVHMHPRAIRQCARAIVAAVRRGVQVILTTHSLELIDALVAASSDQDLEQLSLYRLQLEDGNLKSSHLPGSEVAFARTEIEDDLR